MISPLKKNDPVNDPEPIAGGTKYIILLTYSTWLVIGIWLIYTGIVSTYKNNSENNLYWNYFFGLLKIGFGFYTVRSARAVSRQASEKSGALFRLMTYVIVALLAGIPLLTFIFQAISILSGERQPDDLFYQNVTTLITVSSFYLFATIYSDWRLKNKK